MRLTANDTPGNIIRPTGVTLAPLPSVKSGIGRSSEYFPQIYDVRLAEPVTIEPKKKVTLNTNIALTAPQGTVVEVYSHQALLKLGLSSNTRIRINETTTAVPLVFVVQNNTEAPIVLTKETPVLQYDCTMLVDVRIAWKTTEPTAIKAGE